MNKLTILLLTALLLTPLAATVGAKPKIKKTPKPAADSPANPVPAYVVKKMVGQKLWPVPRLDVSGNALKPPMGWSVWYAFGGIPGPSDRLSREIADALVSSGLKDAGYVYELAFDGGWWSTAVRPGRDDKGGIIVDKRRWPNGIKAVSDFIHAKGLKVAGYTDIGAVGYFIGYKDRKLPHQLGGFHYEQQDADQYAAWEWDYIKIDDHGPGNFFDSCRAVANNRLKRPIIISLSTPGTFPYEFGPRIANMSRVSHDVSWGIGRVRWDWILTEVDAAEPYWWVQSPGHWNDLDILTVGLHGITDEEAKSEFSLWSVFGAPLLLGCDIRPPNIGTSGPAPRVSPHQLEILKNAEVIAVDQDSLGASARLVSRSAKNDVYAKPLTGFTSGAVAALLLNRGEKPSDITVKWTDLGLTSGAATVRDLWAHADLGAISNGYTATAVPPHGVVMVIVKGIFDWSRPRVYEAESSYNTFTGLAWQRCDRSEFRMRIAGNENAGFILISSPEGFASFSSRAGVDGVGNGTGNSLHFNHVAAPKSGCYTIAIAYACDDDRNADLSINGAAATNIRFPRTGGKMVVKEIFQDIELKAGENTLRVGNATAPAPLFDKITLTRKGSSP